MERILEFVSTAFPAYPDEEERINPGRYGQRLAEFLRESLPAHGFIVTDIYPEDWGWVVNIHNEGFRLCIGCGRTDDDRDMFICFIEPAKAFVWRFFRRIETAPITESLAVAMERIITESGKASEIRWQEES